jgi:hypothetical protein
MEKELGFSLVDRSSNSFDLTPAGATFLEYAQQIIDSYAEARGRCLTIAREEQPLKVSGIPVYSAYYQNLGTMRDISYVFVDLDLETSLFTALTKGIVDIGTIIDFTGNALLSKEAEEKGIAYRASGKGKAAICMMRSHPLASKASLTRSDLYGATILIGSGANFDSWKYAVMLIFGEDIGLEFRLSLVRHYSNLANSDLRDSLHICSSGAVRGWFAHREDMVIFDRVDGEELLYPEGFAYLASNASAAALAERLARVTEGSN